MPRKPKALPVAEAPAPVEIPAVDASLELRVSLANAITERDALRCDVTGLRLEADEQANTIATLNCIVDAQRETIGRLSVDLAVQTEAAEIAISKGVVAGTFLTLASAVLSAALYYLL